MKPHLKRIKRKTAADFDYQFPIDNKSAGGQPAEQRHDLRKIAAERLARLRGDRQRRLL
jgi:hypothetical protein